MILRVSQKPVPDWVLILLLLAPVFCSEGARLTVEPHVGGLSLPTSTRPFSRRCRNHPHAPDIATIPTGINSLREIRTFQFHPSVNISIGVRIRLDSMENDLLHFPGVNGLC